MSNKIPVNITPYAVRPKVGAQLAGCGLTEFYRRLNEGRYATFRDGVARLVVVESIHEDEQRLLAEASGTPRNNPAQPAGPGRSKKKNGDNTQPRENQR
jgi:hypothetical protein